MEIIFCTTGINYLDQAIISTVSFKCLLNQEWLLLSTFCCFMSGYNKSSMSLYSVHWNQMTTKDKKKEYI